MASIAGAGSFTQPYVPRKEPPSWTAGGKVVKVDRVEWITMADAQGTRTLTIPREQLAMRVAAA